MKIGLTASLVLLLSGCGLVAQPASLTQSSGTAAASSWTPVKNSETRYLTIAGSQVERVKVEAYADYTGGFPSGAANEFARRYGYTDYVVIQTQESDGTIVGRVYGWEGDSSGVDTPLNAAKTGAQATVVDGSGQITFQGQLLLKHDFVQLVVNRTVYSADGQWVAKLCSAGYSGSNYLVAQKSDGTTYNWQAGSRDGDLYLDAQWLPNGILLTYEGTPYDELVFQVHNAERYVSEVLSAQDVQEDAKGAGISLEPNTTPVISNIRHQGNQLTYSTWLKVSDGSVVQKNWQGILQVDAQGMVTLSQRKLQP